MSRLRYVSRTHGRHDQMWVRTLREAGHSVDAMLVNDIDDSAPVDLMVAGPLSDAVPAAIARGDAPVLALCWGFDVVVEGADPVVRERIASGLRSSAGVHVDCEYLREQVVDLGALPADVTVGAWGIDVEHFRPGHLSSEFRALHGLGREDRVILSTRAWEEMYDVDVVVSAVGEVAAELPGVRLVLAGDGSLAPQVRSRLREAGLTSSCITPGYLDSVDVRDWLRACDAYVGAARSDGSSLSLLEALACGVPVAVPEVGGNAEWVISAVHGQLFKVGSREGLVDALHRLLATSASDETTRAVRRSLVVAKGDWRRNRAVFLGAVDRILEQTR